MRIQNSKFKIARPLLAALLLHFSFLILNWPLHAQPFLRGPLTTNSPAIKPALDGGRLDALTNNFFRVPVEVNTNLIVTNLSIGQVIRIDLFVTNGFTCAFPQQTAANSAQGWIAPVGSNAWQTVFVSKPAAGETNFDVRAVQYLDQAGAAITLTTNFIARTRTIAASGASYRLFTITNDVVVTNVTGPVSVLSNLLGTATLPANFWQPGMRIEIQLEGRYWMTGTLTHSNEVYYGSALLATNSMPYLSSTLGDSWKADLTITCRTTGASGSLYCQGHTWIPSIANGVTVIGKPLRLVSGAVTVDTTASTALDYKFNPGATTSALHIKSGAATITP